MDEAVADAFRDELSRAKARLENYFDRHAFRILGSRELRAFVSETRSALALGHIPVDEIITFLSRESYLRMRHLKSERYPSITRYTWRLVSAVEIGASLRRNAYLSHGTAVFLHGLTDQLPHIVYVNNEQSPKPQGTPPTQDSIARAFANKQRESNYVLSEDDWRYVLLSGKFTNRLEVGQLEGPNGLPIQATKLERTLIDIVVRPAYAGGVVQVLEAFRTAEPRISVSVLVATLKKLGHVYPYHQAIGFYMSRSGYSPRALDQLRRLGLEYDFFLMHGMKQTDYDKSWRLFFPKDLS